MSVDQIVALLVLGVGAGILAGLFGIGGGVLLVPAMVLILGFDQHLAQGTSLVVIIPAAILGSWANRRHARFHVPDAVALGAGGVVGALVGSVVALSVDDAVLRPLFGLFLLALGVRTILTQRKPPASSADPQPDAVRSPDEKAR